MFIQGQIERPAHVAAVVASHSSRFFYAKKNREAIFFGVIQQASQLAWTNRPAHARHSRLCFPHLKIFLASCNKRHSWLGRIDRPAHVTAVAASHTSKFFLRQKKSRSDFFWRHPLRVTARLDVSTVALTSQPSPLPTRQNKKLRQKKIAERFFFGVDRCASQLAWTNRP